MIESFLKPVIGITLIMGGWLVVQAIWRRFSELPAGADALGGRVGCHSCKCSEPCDNSKMQENSVR
ncbi:hypothetical protein CA13_04330 [Planctomycetes bacterium CA13]|uniref:Uncharacterized protein n=1 Tax=Novipirellula herctigrandis TaxID=2527986 RepID=A0A5C5YW88_9BACT|nr:hypothetical protein CA13_04330 [Planctomycetes bacterium CA13]